MFSCVLHNSSKDSWSLPATKSFFTAFCSVSRVQDTWKCTGTLWSQVDCFFQMFSVLQAHGIPSPLSLYLPQEKLWSALHTNCYYSTATQNLSQIVYTVHIIILLLNNPADTLWKKTFTSYLGSWSLVLLLFQNWVFERASVLCCTSCLSSDSEREMCPVQWGVIGWRRCSSLVLGIFWLCSGIAA